MVYQFYKIICFAVVLICLTSNSCAQLKFLVEDFEGMTANANELKANGFFTFGSVKAFVDEEIHSGNSSGAYAGSRAFRMETQGKGDFGGWGKGLSVNLELDHQQDYLNFYINYQDIQTTSIKIEIQEDDNSSHSFEKELDDSWTYTFNPPVKKGWQLVSIPLAKFKDSNAGGDGSFNIGYKKGKLFCLLMSFEDPVFLKSKHVLFFDFISFSKGILPRGAGLFDPPQAGNNSSCALGAWSGEGNSANFVDIATVFENNFKPVGKKLGVVHFFQSYAFDGGTQQNHYPSVERINKVIKAGYVPMITLEDHFVNAHPGTKQPNLYSIVEGHFDSFFGYWASQIKEVNGTVMLRILHEFNGDWYPWCTANNDKDPYLVAKAYRYIINIFRQNNVNNVKLIWCPNSMSVPQESWNYIMDAYPGDDYVDFVGIDVYNGAGSGKGASQWRSFRKEGIENYFILTQKLPSKPLFICETASRERKTGEGGQTKAEWIKDMSVALKTDMSQIKLLEWFDEKETFKVNSSEESRNAFKQYIMKDDFFSDGTKNIIPLFSH